jgi:hypothetical protein
MKRLRKPKLKDGELQMYWGRPDPHDNPDVVLAWQGDGRGSASGTGSAGEGKRGKTCTGREAATEANRKK